MPEQRTAVRGLPWLELVVEGQAGVFAAELRERGGAGLMLATETTPRKALEEARRILELAAEAAAHRLRETA